MTEPVASKSLAGPSEICMLMPIKAGFTDALATQTYEGRLGSFTKLFSDLRAVSRESRLLQPFSDIVDRLETIHGVTISILDGKLLLAVHFDRPWEPYIRLVWDQLGHIFDLILCNCEGYVEAHRNNLGYEAFAGWIRAYQVDTATFYMNANRTVDDVIYLDRLERQMRAGQMDPAALATLPLETPEARAESQRATLTGPAYVDYIKQGVQAIAAFHALSYLYPKGSPDHDYLLRAARAVLPENEFPKRADWQLSAENGRALKTLQAVFFTELDWFENYPESDARQPEPSPMLAFDPDNVQAGITSPYGANVGCLALLQVTDAASARQFLTAFQQTISWGVGVTAEPGCEQIFRNIAFTAAGLARLGLVEAELEKLPSAFRQGMAARAGLIGDLRFNHPDHWRLPERNWPLSAEPSAQRVSPDSVDVVIQLRRLAPDKPDGTGFDPVLVEELTRLAEQAQGGLAVLSVQPMYSRGDPAAPVEHFGFRDGISNPRPSADESDDPDVIPLGDVFLGQPNSLADRHPATWSEPLFKDGTFQVIRKLSQDVGGLNAAVTANIPGRSKLSRKALRAARDELLARLMGRTKDGAPLVGSRQPEANDFDYDKDPDGAQCPLFSHVRRTNPRDQLEFIPRIVRRGMSYGPAYREQEGAAGEEDRGLIFQAYNASIAEQFEIVQRWVSGGNRTAPYSRLSDPILGVPEPGQPRHYRLADGTLVDLGDRPFVRLEWGLYLFVPSRVGLAMIAAPKADAGRDWLAEGRATIDRLRALEDRDRDAAAVAWKRLLEENDSLDDEAHRAVWQVVREEHKGVLETPFGVLVGSAGLVEKVLSEPADFSVAAYQERLSRSLGENYLGMDPPEHDERAARANAVFSSIDERQAFAAALKPAATLLGGLGKVGGQATIPLPKYVDLALAEISKLWFGVPDAPTLLELLDGARPNPRALVQAGGEPPAGAETSHCPAHVNSASRFVFQPQPTAAVDATASREGQRLKTAMDAFVAPYLDKKKKKPKWPSKLTRDVFQALKKDKLEEEFASVLIGGLLGFLPTVQGNFLTSTRDWLREGDFWRVQNAYLAARSAGASEADAAFAVIGPQLARSMARRPVPSMIHRRATRDLTLADVSVGAGQTIVVGLVSAAAEQSFDEVAWVFGGEYYGSPRITHACPGRQLGTGTLLALLAALFELPGSLRPSPSTSALLFDPS